jgi:hypothetical protein
MSVRTTNPLPLLCLLAITAFFPIAALAQDNEMDPKLKGLAKK